MTYSKEVTIKCDGENEKWGDGICFEWARPGPATVRKARRALREEGWTYKGGNDYCPECSE